MARIISTDDAAQRAEFVWLGPVESPWPFHARGTAWVLALIICPVTVVAVYATVPIWAVAPGPVGQLLHLLTSVALGATLGVLAVRAIGRHLTPTRPLRHHAAIVAAENAAPRPVAPTTYVLNPSAITWLTATPTPVRRRRTR